MNLSSHRSASTALLATLFAVSVGGSGCRNHADLNRQYDNMRNDMMRGDWAKAAAGLEASKDQAYKEEDRVMYWLNLGTLLHYAGNYPGSVDNLAKAEAEMQELWTTSISAEATKFLVNETLQSYGGEDFEKILVYFYTSLSRVKEGKNQDAMVEARRADEFLKKMLVEYEKEGAGGTLYREDAFMLWMVGLFYEIEGSWADSYLAYKASIAAYEQVYAAKFGTPAPNFVYEDAARLAQLAGQGGDVAQWKAKGAPASTIQHAAGGEGEVVFIHSNGEAPGKKEVFIDAIMTDGYLLRVALPEFVEKRGRITHAEIQVAGQTGKTEVAEPITNIALENYKYRLPAIHARAIVRATAKYIASKAAEAVAGGKDSTSGLLVGIAANIASAASESADLRSWSTLPANVGVARVWLPAGQHSVTVTYQSGGSTVRTEQIPVEVKAGEHKIISVRTLD